MPYHFTTLYKCQSLFQICSCKDLLGSRFDNICDSYNVRKWRMVEDLLSLLFFLTNFVRFYQICDILLIWEKAKFLETWLVRETFIFISQNWLFLSVLQGVLLLFITLVIMNFSNSLFEETVLHRQVFECLCKRKQRSSA